MRRTASLTGSRANGPAQSQPRVRDPGTNDDPTPQAESPHQDIGNIRRTNGVEQYATMCANSLTVHFTPTQK